ncbi:ABC transporter substrate-binding protein [Phaeodactylibacter luteus]|uniref:Solute-binding protein family 5 domain-containing protein n=1 Tax=Phaeodactylibacter luteus TaxID=1564516 RepID=A0A5C6RJV9_9BACT|nr:ABC transporter substrate-binding protein [Phaeodactylibacter luteus]TXB61612.1 hypothetical protein FRY97_18230 [Phaeodactylibacter luteus]
MNMKITLRYLPLALSFALIWSCAGEPKEKKETPTDDYGLERPATEAVLQLDTEPDRLNPVLTLSNYSNTVIGNLFSYLQSINPETMELEPQLAVSQPDITPIEEGPFAGGVAYTFEIRPEAVWDNGSPITADDFVFTLKATFNPKVPAPAYRVYLSFIGEVEKDAANPRRFTVYTNRPYMIGAEAISAALPILPAYHYDSLGLMSDIPLADLMDEERAKALSDNENIVQFAEQFASPFHSREPNGISGSGPYKLERWETGQRLVLSRKEGWWGDQAKGQSVTLQAYPEKLIYRPVKDPTAAVTALKDGQLDVLPNIPPDQFLDLQKTDFVTSRYNLHTPPSLVHTFIYTNTRSPKLNDPKVRRALAMATDVSTMIETAFSGLGEPSTGPVHPSFSYYNPVVKPLAYAPEEARALLEEAGWTDTNDNGIVDKEIDGQRTELELEYKFTAGRAVGQNIALILQESAKRAGISIKLTPQEHTVNLDDLKRRDFELVAGAKSIPPTPWEPKQDFHSEGDDRTGFATPETDALIDQIQQTLDPEDRKKLYLDLQRQLYEAMPIVPLIVPTGRLAIHKRYTTPITPMFPGYVAPLLQLEQAN